MKVLFISYYYDPFPGVGAKRTTYWANNLSKYGIHIDVITASEQNVEQDNVLFLDLKPSKGLLAKLIKDPGLSWKNQLLNHFKTTSNFNYDVVLFSGGPFMHFGVGGYLKKRFGCKIILDYRDPFGYNPRHKDNWLKKNIKTYFEKKFNRMADLITTVNEICKSDMTFSEKVEVIPNGFDDETLKKQDSIVTDGANKGVLFNGGKLYPDISLDPLLNVLEKDPSLYFNQVGQKNEQIDTYGNQQIQSKGFVAYKDLLNYINQSEICLVLTGGEPFETPTKTYDYIALNKKILVITEGEIKTGGIHSILSTYPNVEWAKNDQKSITKGIAALQAKAVVKFDSYPYSRAYGLKKLSELLNSLK